MTSASKIVVYGTTDHGLDIHYESTARLNAAIGDLLEFITHRTPIHPGSLQAIEFAAAVAEARGQSANPLLEKP